MKTLIPALLAALTFAVVPAAAAPGPSGFSDGGDGPQVVCTVEVSPGQSISSAFNTAPSGATVCVHAGTYDEHVVLTANGTATAPRYLVGYPGEVRPLVRPTAVVPAANESLRIGGDFQHVSGINFQGSVNACSNCQGMVVWFMTASNDSSLTDSDVSLNRIGSGVFLTGVRDRVERVSSHDNFDEANYQGDQAHGFYVQGSNHTLVNNLAYNHAEGWGIQLYPNGAGAGTLISQNTLEGNLMGCVTLYSNAQVRNSICEGDDGFVDGPGATGCIVADNIVWPGPANAPTPCTKTNNMIADPLFAGPDNFHIAETSPAVGYANPAYSFSPDFDTNARDADPDAGAYEMIPASICG